MTLDEQVYFCFQKTGAKVLQPSKLNLDMLMKKFVAKIPMATATVQTQKLRKNFTI